MLAMAAAVPDARAEDDPIALARAGTEAIENRRFGDALQAFTKAAGMRPDDASLCFGAGVAAFMLGQNDVARMRFECALTINPNYREAAVWLADLHYRSGRLHDAISVYETARRHSPADRDIQQQLSAWRKEHQLESRFHELRTPHFSALYESSANGAIARDVVERLETAYRRIGRTLGLYPSDRITVVLYTREQFRDITKLAGWSAAAFDGRIRLPVGPSLEEPEELDRVLSHELVHAIAAEIGGRNVPAWMSEGLATALEPAGSTDVEATLAASNARPLSTLHRGFVDFSRPDAEVAYASAARAVRRLIEQRGVAAVVSLLQDLGRGAPFASAFEQRIAIRYEDFAAAADVITGAGRKE